MRSRDKARRVIAEVIDAHEELLGNVPELVKLIDATYPFGPRRHYPYTAWLAERRKAIAALAHASIHRPCPVCGARARRFCRAINGEALDEGGLHAARSPGPSDAGPLFGGGS